jgi:TonB family protein
MTNSTPVAPPPPDPVAHTLALLRPWIDFVPPRQRRLGLFIFVALLLHLATFFFIRIDATPVEFQHQARTHVTVEAPALAVTGDSFWDRLADPRLFLLPMLPAPSSLQPGSAEGVETSLGASLWPEPAGPGPIIHAAGPTLAERAAAALVPPRQPFAYADTTASAAPATDWQWDAALAARAPAGVAALPTPVSDTDLKPTELRVAVDASGAVRDVLMEETSQKPELDEQAILAAQKVHFRPVPEPGLSWGRLTIFWHPTAPPAEVVVPTPPTPSP